MTLHQTRNTPVRIRIETSIRGWLQRALLAWFKSHARDFPWRRRRTPYRILIAEILLQQTAAWKVASVYDTFINRYRTPRELSAASIRSIISIIKPLGLVRRAGLLKRLGQMLQAEHSGRVPRRSNELLELPGVGPYTRAALNCFAFGRREAIVDTNVVRFMTRFFGLTPPPNRRELTVSAVAAAEQCLPMRRFENFNLALLDHAALVCKFNKPRCEVCPVAQHCEWLHCQAGSDNLMKLNSKQHKRTRGR